MKQNPKARTLQELKWPLERRAYLQSRWSNSLLALVSRRGRRRRERVGMIRVNQNSWDGFDFDWKSGETDWKKDHLRGDLRRSGNWMTVTVAQFSGLKDWNISKIQQMASNLTLSLTMSTFNPLVNTSQNFTGSLYGLNINWFQISLYSRHLSPQGPHITLTSAQHSLTIFWFYPLRSKIFWIGLW